MNVLYVCADRGVPVLGDKGASVHVRSITAAMQGLGHRVTLAARRLGSGNPPPRLHRLEQLSPDLDETAGLLEGLIRAERPEVVIERYSLGSGAARLATQRCGVPLTLEVNAPLALEFSRYRGLNDPSAIQHEHKSLRSADRIHVVSSALWRYVSSVAPAVPAAWIPNGADIARFRVSRSPALTDMDERLIVGFVGSMKPWHGIEQLIEAFARIHPQYPEAALVLVGTGPRAGYVSERLRRNDLRRNVVWTGHVPHAEVPSLVACFDVAVAPYSAVDGFYFDPLKVVEYLAAGKAVVYSSQGELRSLVGAGGLSYAPDSLGELTHRLEQAVSSPSLRHELTASASARAVGLDWRAIAQRVLRFASGADGATVR